MKPKLNIVIASTRPGRVGPSLAAWFNERAQEHGGFEAALVDLATFNLAVYDEPRHPRLRQYEHEHTKRWSASVESADAFVFVTPEYNYAPTPALVNALDYVLQEWAYKPAAFMSYGGISGGLRAVQTTKLMLTALKMVPITEAVVVPLFPQHLDAERRFQPNETQTKAATEVLDELLRVSEALKPLRAARS